MRSPLRIIVRTMNSTGMRWPLLVEQHALVGRLLARGDHRRDLRHVVGRDELERLAAEHLLERVADQLADRRVGVGDEAVLVEHDALGARLHELREPLLRFAHRQLGQAVLRDVGDQHEGADAPRRSAPRCGSRFTSIQRVLAVRALQRALVDRRPALASACARPAAGSRARPRSPITSANVRPRIERSSKPKVSAYGLLANWQLQVARVVVRDQHRHVVGEQAEQLGLRLRGGTARASPR